MYFLLYLCMASAVLGFETASGVSINGSTPLNVNLTVAVINNTLSIPAIFPVANSSLPYGYQFLPDSISSVITIAKNGSCIQFVPGLDHPVLTTDCKNGTYFYTVGGNITGVNASVASLHPLYDPTLCLLGVNDTVIVENCGLVAGNIWWQYNTQGKNALVWQGELNTTAAVQNNSNLNVTIVNSTSNNIQSTTDWVITDVTSNITCLPNAKYDICLHNGTCVNNLCICTDSYEGLFCNTTKVNTITQSLHTTCGSPQCTSCTTVVDCLYRSPFLGIVSGSSSSIICLNGNCVCAAPQSDELECIVTCDTCGVGCLVNNGSCADSFIQ